jgi:hypothetical protein
MEPIYRHSGALGDIIYALSLFHVVPPGNLLIALNNCDKICTTEYGYAPTASLGNAYAAHNLSLTQEAYNFLKPLLDVQPYLTNVTSRLSNEVDPDNTINLDNFRYFFARGRSWNYVETYYKTFSIPYVKDDHLQPWLHNIEPKQVRPAVVTRTSRYRSPLAEVQYKEYAKKLDLENTGIFIGLPEEHEDFVTLIDCKIPYYQVTDALEEAQIIKGAACFLGNQTFAYSLATALGIPTILETRKTTPLPQNECYFDLPNKTYF